MSSNQPFEYAQVAVKEGGERDIRTAERQQDGSYRKTFEGNDTLNDISLGGGNDTVTVRSESEQLAPESGLTTRLGKGDDTYDGSGSKQTANIVAGEQGNDTITTGDGSDLARGGEGDDSIATGGGDDTALGDAGNDTITTGDGSDIAEGGEGDDSIATGGGNDTALGGAGNDTITTGDGNDAVKGGDGDDTITTGSGDDIVSGGLGGDTITTGDGADRIYMGKINDPDKNFDLSAGDPRRSLSDISEFSSRVTRTDTGTNTVSSGAGDDRVYGSLADGKPGDATLQHDIDTGDGDDLIEAGSGQNRMKAGSGDDFVLGGSGNDTILGESGNDTLLGVDGDDRIDGGEGNDTVAGGRGTNVTSGGSGTDREYYFARNRGESEQAEQSTAVDSTDNLGGFDFSQGRLTENAMRGVESTPAGQEMYRSIRQGREDNAQPRTVVADSDYSEDTGNGLFAYDSDTVNVVPGTSVDDTPGSPGNSVSRASGPDASGFVKAERGPGGLPVSGGGERSNSALLVNQGDFRSSTDLSGNGNNSVSTAAHESTHVDQFMNGNWPLGSTSTQNRSNGEESSTSNAELDAIGLPYDVTGDGVADAESKGRFDGQVGESENSVRSDLGMTPRTTYNNAAPSLDESDAVAANGEA